MSKPKPKFRIGQVVWQFEEFAGQSGMYADIEHRAWNSDENKWEYFFGMGVDRMYENEIRPLNARERAR